MTSQGSLELIETRMIFNKCFTMFKSRSDTVVCTDTYLTEKRDVVDVVVVGVGPDETIAQTRLSRAHVALLSLRAREADDGDAERPPRVALFGHGAGPLLEVIQDSAVSGISAPRLPTLFPHL